MTAADDLGSSTQEIVGGSTAQPSEYPSVVDLEEVGGDWFCTGTLITPEWVLTAAHCVDEEGGRALQIRYGVANVNQRQGGTVVAVGEVHEKEDFDYDAWDNDIALLKLATPVTGITPTPIYRPQLPAGSTVMEVGYGASSNNQQNDGAGILRKVQKTTVACSAANDPGISDANLICMDASDGKGSCYGDSGGPAFFSNGGALTVAGVTSGGSGQDCGAGFDLYTSVYGELAWVDMIMGNATDPGDDGSGSGSGGGDGSGSGTGDGDGDGAHHSDDGGCSTTGSPAGLAFIGLAALFVRRRRR